MKSMKPMIAINTTVLAVVLFLSISSTQAQALKTFKVSNYPSGEVSQVEEYKDGKQVKTISYNQAGQLASEKYFSKAGALEEINSYINGKPSESYTYYPSGKVAAHIEWRGGTTIATFHYATGEVEEVSRYADDTLLKTVFYEKSGAVKPDIKVEPLKSNTPKIN